MIKKTIAITGASGFVGQYLVNHFKGSGWNVVALVRNPEIFNDKPYIDARKYDITQPVNPSILKGVDVLIHAAYIKATDNDRSKTFELNTEGAKNLYKASATVSKKVFISSMSSKESALSIYGRQKIEIENIFSNSSDLVIRPGFIVGNGGIYNSILGLINKYHVVPMIGFGKQPLQIISIDDLVKGIESGVNSDLFGILTIAHTEPISYRNFFTKVSKKHNTRCIFLPFPYWFFFVLIKVASVILPKLDISTDNLKGLKNLEASDNIKDMRALNLNLPQLKKYLDSITY